MITGVVNNNLEATIQLKVRGANEQFEEIEAIIDTGFTGFLTLPLTVIEKLNLTWLCRQHGILANGEINIFDVYRATLIWDKQPINVEVDSIDSEPLVGMNL